jgi:hypothetical protein
MQAGGDMHILHSREDRAESGVPDGVLNTKKAHAAAAFTTSGHGTTSPESGDFGADTGSIYIGRECHDSGYRQRIFNTDPASAACNRKGYPVTWTVCTERDGRNCLTQPTRGEGSPHCITGRYRTIRKGFRHNQHSFRKTPRTEWTLVKLLKSSPLAFQNWSAMFIYMTLLSSTSGKSTKKSIRELRRFTAQLRILRRYTKAEHIRARSYLLMRFLLALAAIRYACL